MKKDKLYGNYQDINWKKCQNELLTLQQQLVEAYREKNTRKVKNLQRQIVTSFAARALAVRRVTLNKGGNTSGVDGITWNSPKSRLQAIHDLRNLTQNPKRYKARPVKRVEIPKPGKNELRPLGIPCLIDRAMQAVYLSSIDPICEETSDANSYGFRPYRGSREAIAKLRNLLGKDYSPNWILDADIQKCFHTINHDWLLKNVPIGDLSVLSSWLKAGVATASGPKATEQGVPQGGVIWPALCNITLNGMEAHVQNATKHMVLKRQRTKVYVVRYADDFIVTADSEAILEKARRCVQEFLAPRGLVLNPEKTRAVQLDKVPCIEFLGFALAKRPLDPRKNMPSAKNLTRNRLIIKPSRSNITSIKTKIAHVLKHGRPIGAVIKELNPKLRGWTNYFRVGRHSAREFKTLGNWIWVKMLRWAQKKHTNRNIDWIRNRYIAASKWRSNHWANKTQKGNQYLLDVSTVKYQFVPALTQGLNPYVEVDRSALDTRSRNLATGKEAGLRRALLTRDNTLCLVCDTSLVEGEESVELHHLDPLRTGGGWALNNLVLLHATCHKKVTYDEELNLRLKSQIHPNKPA